MDNNDLNNANLFIQWLDYMYKACDKAGDSNKAYFCQIVKRRFKEVMQIA